MFIQHPTRELWLRVVITGPADSGALQMLQALHGRVPGEEILERQHGHQHMLQFGFKPPGLGEIRGYAVRCYVHAVDTTGPDYDPTNLSGFSQIDGLILAGRGHRIPETIAAAQLIAGGLAAAGYDWSTLPLVVQIARDGQPDLGAEIRRMTRLGDRPIQDVSLADGAGIIDGFKALLKQMLVAAKEGRLHVVESEVGSQLRH